MPDPSPRPDRRRPWGARLFILSGFVPLLGLLSHPPDPMLLIYSLFVAARVGRRRLVAWADRLPGPTGLHLFILFQVSGALTETLAWTNNYLRAAPEPALFHPQLLADLLIGVGFYGGWALAWTVALRWYRYTLTEAFLITGLQGVFFEQLGAAFLAMLTALPGNPLAAVLLGLYVVAVHGSAAGLPLALVLHRCDGSQRSRHWLRIPIVVILMVGLAFLGALLIAALCLPFGGLPPERSIIERPLW